MLERCQSLLQYYHNIASLQDWYSSDRGSHTPLQDEGDEPVMDLVTGCRPDVNTETRAQRQTVSGPGCGCTRAVGCRFDTLDWSRCS